MSSPPQPAGCVTATPLLSPLSKNMLSHFLNPACGATDPKEAANAVTGFNSKEHRCTIIVKKTLKDYLKVYVFALPISIRFYGLE